MPDLDRSNLKSISSILDSKELLIKSELGFLSSLNNKEMEYLEGRWLDTDVKRRRKIVSDIVELSVKKPVLDFSSIFCFFITDPDAKVRADSIAGLAEEVDEKFISTFTEVLEKDTSWEVRSASALALGKLAIEGELGKISEEKTNIIYDALLSALDKKSEVVRVKDAALIAIAPLNKPRVKGLIEKAYHSDNEEKKISAIKAMGLNCNKMWMSVLVIELQNENDAMRYAAVKAIGELSEEDAVLHILELVEDDNPKIQEAAIQALGEVGGEEARNILNSLVNNPEQRIRRAAKSALQVLEICESQLSLNS